MVSVPASYVPLLNEMSAGTGIPYAVEAAQANEESGFNATAVSKAGAEGWLQFLPSTYDSYAQQAGVADGTEFNPGDEAQVYIVYMNALLKLEGGNVYNALAAYNAGFEPGTTKPNPAGDSYAQAILSAAGQSGSLNTGAANTTSNTSSSSGLNPLDLLTGIANPNLASGASNAFASGIASGLSTVFTGLLESLGVTSIKDFFIRSGLIILGGIILILALREFIGGGKTVEIAKAAVGG